MLQLKNVQHDFDVVPGDVGVTVRLGPKWAKAYDDEPGRFVDLWQCERPHDGACPETVSNEGGYGTRCLGRGTARLIGYWYGKLAYVPAGLLTLEHEREARELSGLLTSLARAYGSRVTWDSEVTALIYERIHAA